MHREGLGCHLDQSPCCDKLLELAGQEAGGQGLLGLHVLADGDGRGTLHLLQTHASPVLTTISFQLQCAPYFLCWQTGWCCAVLGQEREKIGEYLQGDDGLLDEGLGCEHLRPSCLLHCLRLGGSCDDTHGCES